MEVEFRPAQKHEALTLRRFDMKMFEESDWFTLEEWKLFTCYWIVVNRQKVGSIALAINRDFWEIDEEKPKYREGSMFIASTGLAPEFRGKGIGDIAKVFELGVAKDHGCTRIITNCRESNEASIGLNTKHGFEIVRHVPNYYHGPVEAATVLEYRTN